MPLGRRDSYDLLSPKSLSKVGGWFREAMTSIATEVTHAILDDIDDLEYTTRSQSTHNQTATQGSSSETEEPKLLDCPPDVIKLLSNDSTYLSDPDPSDKDDFDSFVINPTQASELLRQFPSLRMRIEHYKVSSMVNEEERILKRILFKINKLEPLMVVDPELVMVDEPQVVLVEEHGDFVEWH